MQLQLVTLSHGGKPFFVYASTADPGTASFEAGQLMDRLTDCYGDGFSYAVAPIGYGGTMSLRFASACAAYETGDGNPFNLER